ncbi:MAG: hypothetical protein M1834_009394 [Cirrosporium novae-zelandiae]|nr:MAG: hypothetical protein M1834_009394 [Cirrosporium novae-zelandiae]
MAPSRPAARKEARNYSNIGHVGRRTGITLKDDGVRDEYGLQPVDGLFSSPEKSPDRINGTRLNATISSEEDMDVDQSTAPDPKDVLSVRRPYLPPPRARSPLKTNLNSSPRRSTISSPTRHISSSPGQSSSQPVTRRLNFSTADMNTTLARSSADIGSSPPEIPNGRYQRELSDQDQTFSDDEVLPMGMDDEPIDNLLKTNDNDAAHEEATDEEREETESPIRETFKKPAPIKSPPRKPQPSKGKGRGRKKAAKDGGEVSAANAKGNKRGAKVADEAGSDIELQAEAEEAEVGEQGEAEEEEEEEEELEEEELEEEELEEEESEEEELEEEESEEAEVMEEAEEQVEAEEAPEPLVERNPGKAAGKKRGRKAKNAKEVDNPETEDPEATERSPKRQKPSQDEKPRPGKRGRPPRGSKPPTDGNPNSQTTESAGEKRKKLPGRPGRGLALLKPEAKANEGELYSVSRYGRHIIPPVAYWRNEAIIFEDDSQETAIGKRFRMPTIAEVRRVDEEIDRPKRTHKKAGRRKKGRAESEEVSEDDREEWEVGDGILTGEVKVWDPETEQATDDHEDNDIAFASDKIEMRDVKGATFKFAKAISTPFFGSGFVDLPPGGVKRPKNSRTMQMVFFVFYGRVSVDVNGSTFNIGKGGMWQVPRGNSYSISNPYTKPARIFFAQGCEMSPSTETEE